MNPVPEHEEDALAALLRAAYGGDANVELTDDGGMNVWIYPAKGGTLHAWLSGMDSPMLHALLSALDRRQRVYGAAPCPNAGDPLGDD